jgi:hypothetical protein
VSSLDLALDAAVLAWILYRGRRVRRVRLRFARRTPVILAVLGLFQFVHYNESHSLGAEAAALVIASCVVVAAAFGALRGATVRLSPAGRGALDQQATWLTEALWLVSIAAHFAMGAALSVVHGPVGATAGSAVLYLAVSLGAQNTMVHRRAVRAIRTGGVGTGAQLGTVEARSWEGPAPTPPASS